MEKAIIVFICLTVPCLVNAEQYPSLVELNDDLVPIYERLIKSDDPNELIGERLELTLSLRHASEERLLFNDTRIIIDEKTKYYFVMWKFAPKKVAEVTGKSDIQCRIEGRIVAVVVGNISPGMPYIVVEVENVEL